MSTTFQIQQTAPVLAFLLRAMVRRIDRKAMPRDRARHLETEVTENLLPLVIAARSTQEFIRNVALRFGVNLTGGTYVGADGGEHVAAPLYLVIPRDLIAHAGLAEMEHERVRDRPEMACVRWDVAAGAADFQALRMHINANPYHWATFAFADDDPSDVALFEVPDPAVRDATPFVAPLPTEMVAPHAYRSIWTLLSNLSHGADADTGNFSTFRRERVIDPTTGEQHLVPMLSANAVRGLLRDMAAAILCADVAVEPTALPPIVAHALFSGGTLEQGADGGVVDLALRRRLREMLPPWDVFGGVWAKKQICPGILVMHDALVVCTENAWRVHQHLVRPEARADLPFEAFRASLPRADDLTQLRQGTRHAHREFEDAAGYQMLWQDEILLPGTRVCHSFQVRSLGAVASLSRSFVARLFEEFRAQAVVGAGIARGMGQIAFDPYRPGPGEPELPSSDEYRAWIAGHAAEVRELLMTEGRGAAPTSEAAPAKKGRGRGKGAEA